MSDVEHGARYGRAIRWLHWITALAIVFAYALAELRGYAPRGSPLRAGMMQWHGAIGLLVLLLFLPRLGLRFGGTLPVSSHGRLVTLLARATHLALYVFMLVQPLLGIVLQQAGDRAITLPLVEWTLPTMIGPDHDLHELTEDIHKLLGKIFYGVIGLHIAAALGHHFIVRDNTLRRML